jgi:hypothetical protein
MFLVYAKHALSNWRYAHSDEYTMVPKQAVKHTFYLESAQVHGPT